MRIRAIVPVVLILALIMTACGGDKKEPTKGDVIVYAAAPLSGFQANGGQTVATIPFWLSWPSLIVSL